MAKLNQTLTGASCFPIGWIAARLADGQWEKAIIDAIGVLALFGFLHLVSALEDRWPT